MFPETYRLWIIWGRNRYVVVFPILALIGLAGTLNTHADGKPADISRSRVRRHYSPADKLGADTSRNISQTHTCFHRNWLCVFTGVLVFVAVQPELILVSSANLYSTGSPTILCGSSSLTSFHLGLIIFRISRITKTNSTESHLTVFDAHCAKNSNDHH
jgi:hypothetical protein